MTLEIWSCNPNDIPIWTEGEINRLKKALGEIFGWKRPMTEQEMQTYTAANTGKFFQHVDGGIYQFHEFGKSTEDSSKWLVAYYHHWPFPRQLWLRPIEEWTQERFTPITTEYAILTTTQDRVVAQAQVTANREARKAAASKETFNGESSI